MTAVLSSIPSRLTVRVTSAGLPGGLEMFTPGSSMQWDNCNFVLNAPYDTKSDFWIVFGNAFPHETGRVARTNTLFIAGEPPAKKVYPRGFYNQFAHIVDTHNSTGHPDVHLDALGLCWMVGLSWKQKRFTLGYDTLKKLPPGPKQNRVSVCCSTTAQTAGQKQRLKFLTALKKQLGDDLVVFGKGFQLVDDKLEATLPYRYHLVLENSQSPHYWTEKLTDAYLGWAFPLYVGCPNLSNYFAPESFTALGMTDVNAAAQTIRSLLKKQINETDWAVLQAARNKVLDIYNPFARFAHWTNRFYHPTPKAVITVRNEKAFRWVRGWFYRFKHRNY